MHNHGAIKHAITIADEEIGIEPTIASNHIVGAIDKGINALGYVRLLFFLDTGAYFAKAETIIGYDTENFSTSEVGLLETIPEAIAAAIAINATKVIITSMVGHINRKAYMQEWWLLSQPLVKTVARIIGVVNGIMKRRYRCCSCRNHLNRTNRGSKL